MRFGACGRLKYMQMQESCVGITLRLSCSLTTCATLLSLFMCVCIFTAGAAAFAPLAAVPRVARTGATGLCMNAGTGKIKSVAAFRAGNKGRSLVPTDQDSIDLDLVNGVKDRRDTVGGVDTTYAKPGSSFFSFGENPSGENDVALL